MTKRSSAGRRTITKLLHHRCSAGPKPPSAVVCRRTEQNVVRRITERKHQEIITKEESILFDVNVELCVTAKRIHRTHYHRRGKTTIFGVDASRPDIVRMTVVPIELDPLNVVTRLEVRLDRCRAVGDDYPVRAQTTQDLLIPNFEERNRSCDR
jgi:hypothetical protein